MPAIHTAAPASTAAVAANAASATSDCRRRHGTISSVASTSGQSLNAVPIASAQPRTIGRSCRQAGDREDGRRRRPGVDPVEEEPEHRDQRGGAVRRGGEPPAPEQRADDDRVGDQIEDDDAEAERARVRRAAARAP